MPPKPRWLLAIPDAISQLEKLDRALLTRRDIERLFGVSTARAATLMQTFGAEMTGYQRTLPRTKLLRLARRAAWRERPRKICGQKDTPTAAPAGYFAAFFLRSAQEAVIRSETAFFSSAVIGRRFLVGLASDAVSATGVAAAAGRREEERRAAGFAGAEVPSILSTSFNALISPCKRSISL